MCEYNKENVCTLSNEICPFVYFCNTYKMWRPLKSMPSECGVKALSEIPNGYNKVREERKGYLYVDIENQTYKILNPFEDVPKYVKATKTKSGWRLKK